MIPTRIGQECHGGTFTGFNRIGNTVYGVIVAHKSTEVELKQKNSNTPTPNTQSTVDGFSNTNAMNDRVHPAAYYCKNLSINGCNDWYLPSKNELELCYRHLKPTAQPNITYRKNTCTGNLSTANGENLFSIPKGMPYTKTSPAQTIVTQWISTDCRSVDDWCWTSTESSTYTYTSLSQDFSNGYQRWNNKTNVSRLRGIRRVLILQI